MLFMEVELLSAMVILGTNAAINPLMNIQTDHRNHFPIT